jgi:hypothetical protein
MGQVIDLPAALAPRTRASATLYRCTRCGADLWNILADGRVRCADCEQECPVRTARVNGREYESGKGE